MTSTTRPPLEITRIGRVVRSFNPDTRWFHPMLATLWLYVIAGVHQWTHLSPWVMLPVGVATTVAAVGTVKRAFPFVDYGERQERTVTRLAMGAGLAATGWLVYAGHQPRVAPLAVSTQAFGVLICGSIAVGAFYWMATTNAPARKAALTDARTEAKEAHEQALTVAQQEQTAAEHKPLMDRAKLPGMRVTAKRDTAAGYMLVIEDSADNPYRFEGLHAQCGTIASLLSRELAPQGIKLAAHQVRAEETDSAHVFHLHVSTKNVFTGNLDYPVDTPVGSIRNPLAPGLYEDGTPVHLTLAGKNGVMVATTGGGKSVFAHNLIGGVTRTNNARLWIGGTLKLAPLVIPWLAPWLLGHTDRPVIHRIAGQDPRQVTQMLADFYEVVCRHNDTLGDTDQRISTPEDPAVMCFIDEASHLLKNFSHIKVKTHEGQDWNATQIINATAAVDRSAEDGMFFFTQFGLMDAFGTAGSDIKRNLTVRVAGRTETAYDGTATLVRMNHVDTTRLNDNTLLVQPSVEHPRAIPAKAFFLKGGQMIAPIAARNTGNQGDLPEYVTSQLGDDYTNRWAAHMLPELVKAAYAAYKVSWPETSTPSLPAVERGTVDATTGKDEEAGMSTNDLMEHGAAQMERAREQIRQHGALGPTMSAVFGKINAVNAPEFVSVSLLASVIGWDRASGALVEELSGEPWGLVPVTRDGESGWFKINILGSIRHYLTGEDTPRGDVPADTTTLLTAMKEALPMPASREWVTTEDIYAAIADRMSWGNTVDAGRKLSTALSPLGVQATRPSIDGQKRMAYSVPELVSAIERYAA